MNSNEELINIALADSDSGYNCAQSVLKQYCEALGLSSDVAMRLASGFGGGMRMGRTCGAITGGIMALGLKFGFTQPGDSLSKERLESIISTYITDVKNRLGTCDCNDLMGIDVTIPEVRRQAKEDGLFKEKCPTFIRTAMEELEKRLSM